MASLLGARSVAYPKVCLSRCAPCALPCIPRARLPVCAGGRMAVSDSLRRRAPSAARSHPVSDSVRRRALSAARSHPVSDSVRRRALSAARSYGCGPACGRTPLRSVRPPGRPELGRYAPSDMRGATPPGGSLPRWACRNCSQRFPLAAAWPSTTARPSTTA
jgi:hypothetical protein